MPHSKMSLNEMLETDLSKLDINNPEDVQTYIKYCKWRRAFLRDMYVIPDDLAEKLDVFPEDGWHAIHPFPWIYFCDECMHSFPFGFSCGKTGEVYCTHACHRKVCTVPLSQH